MTISIATGGYSTKLISSVLNYPKFFSASTSSKSRTLKIFSKD